MYGHHRDIYASLIIVTVDSAASLLYSLVPVITIFIALLLTVL